MGVELKETIHLRKKQGGEVKTKKRPCRKSKTKVNMEGNGLDTTDMKSKTEREGQRTTENERATRKRARRKTKNKRERTRCSYKQKEQYQERHREIKRKTDKRNTQRAR